MQIGDNVLAVDQNASKGSWPLGNMVETYPDDSEFVRKALVKKTLSTFLRPISKLVMALECQPLMS